MPEAGPPAPVSPPAATLRISFAYRGRDVRLVAGRRVAMIAPPPVTPPPAPGQAGYWFELRGAAGELLYHRALANPIRADIEVFAEDARQSIARVPVPAAEGMFELLVPDLPEARTLHFFGTPAGARSESAPSRELYRADIDELRKRFGDAPPAGPGVPPGGHAPR